MNGFFAIDIPTSPKVYVDAGPLLIGVVFQLQGAWHVQSFPLPEGILKVPIVTRQQTAELYGIFRATKVCLTHNILEPTLVIDSQSSFGAVLKGNTGGNIDRIRILQKLQIVVQRKAFLAYLQLINTRFHPEDIPAGKNLTYS